IQRWWVRCRVRGSAPVRRANCCRQGCGKWSRHSWHCSAAGAVQYNGWTQCPAPRHRWPVNRRLHVKATGGHSESFRDLFTPKLVSVLREGYGRSELASDALSALTVAIVALPLSMAIAIASGVEPERGLYAAIFGGFLVSALGG